MNSRRRGSKREVDTKSIFLIIAAVAVVMAAVYVIVHVAGKIKSDYEGLEFTKEDDESTVIDIELKEEDKIGWSETDKGWKYLVKKNEYAVDQWLEIDGYLYYFGEDGYMLTGEMKQEGQIFTLHNTKGYLKEIQKDWDFVPEPTEENLNSMVKTNAFWCFLQEQEEDRNTPFKVIQFRKAVDHKIKPLGDEVNPEKTTKDSMKAYGDYVYYLPMVKESQFSLLSQQEKELCNKLFRMIPGHDVKELIADHVDGFLVLDDVIFYSQEGKIYTATSGVEYTTGDERYSVIIEADDCYLVDEKGDKVVSEEENLITVGDRTYQVDRNGKIRSVKQADIVINGSTYYLSGNGTNSTLSVKTQEGDKSLIKEPYGIQSYCIVDKEIYFSAYVDKKEGGPWNSQIFKSSLDGKNKEKVSDVFPGSVGALYYDGGEIYGEYYPSLWKQGYGQLVVITKGGSIYTIEDTSVRTGTSVDGNDRLQLVMMKDGKLTALWQDCIWNSTGGVTDILWNKGVELDPSVRSILETKVREKVEETTKETQEETRVADPLKSTVPTKKEEIVVPIVEPKESEEIVNVIPLER